MSDPTNPDRVPLDRPPVPRFNPLPDLPDLPEMPRQSAPTPSIPIPAPPLPAPRVVVDLPRPSPSVAIDAPPRPAPRATMPTPPKPPEPAPTPAPQGRWVGEALSTLVRPTKSKATVLAAAGCLVAGAFGLQLLVGTSPPSTPPTGKTVVVKATEAAEMPPELDEHSDAKPTPGDADDVASPRGAPFSASDAAAERFGERPDPAPFSRPLEAPPGLVKIKPAAFPLPDANITLVGGQSPPGPVVPMLPELPAVPTTPLPMLPTPAAPLPVLPTPTPPAPTPAVPEPVKVTPVAVPSEVPKAPPLPALPPKLPDPVSKPVEAPKPADVTKPFEPPATRPAPQEPMKPVAPGFRFDPDPPAPAPVPPAPVVPLKPAFTPVETPPEPRRIPPTPVPAAGEARTDFDVDLHPAQAGQTYESVSKQHYGDAKYADALRSFNKNRDPGRDELQIPPTDALRKLAAAGRTPAVNPIAPAGGESWAPPAALGGSKPVAGRSYTVTQDGTTFRDLAGTLLNDRTKYRRISDLNPSIDPNAKLQKGDKVAVP